MTPQRYVNLIIEKLELSRSATFDQIYSYCIANADRIDPGDEEKIIKLIKNTLEPLCYYGSLSKRGEKYTVECDFSKIQMSVFDDTPKMKTITEQSIDALNEMDKRISYDQEPLLRN